MLAPPTWPYVSAARNRSQKGCDAAASLASLVPTSLASLVLAPIVFIGACAEPNIRGHGQRLDCDAQAARSDPRVAYRDPAPVIHIIAYTLAE